MFLAWTSGQWKWINIANWTFCKTICACFYLACTCLYRTAAATEQQEQETRKMKTSSTMTTTMMIEYTCRSAFASYFYLSHLHAYNKYNIEFKVWRALIWSTFLSSVGSDWWMIIIRKEGGNNFDYGCKKMQTRSTLVTNMTASMRVYLYPNVYFFVPALPYFYGTSSYK